MNWILKSKMLKREVIIVNQLAMTKFQTLLVKLVDIEIFR